MKKFCLGCLCIGLCMLYGCGGVAMPLNVIIKNQTLPYSSQHTITVVYAEDKRVRDKYTDIYLLAENQGANFKIAKELGQFINVSLPEANTWYSLSQFFNAKPVSFKTVETTTYIIMSEKSATLTIKAVGGNLDVSDEKSPKLSNVFDVSKEAILKL